MMGTARGVRAQASTSMGPSWRKGGAPVGRTARCAGRKGSSNWGGSRRSGDSPGQRRSALGAGGRRAAKAVSTGTGPTSGSTWLLPERFATRPQAHMLPIGTPPQLNTSSGSPTPGARPWPWAPPTNPAEQSPPFTRSTAAGSLVDRANQLADCTCRPNLVSSTGHPRCTRAPRSPRRPSAAKKVGSTRPSAQTTRIRTASTPVDRRIAFTFDRWASTRMLEPQRLNVSRSNVR
jgi:hypothetical protein